MLLLGGASGAQAQTCSQVVNFNYSNVADGDRIAGSDQLSGGTPGTSVTYSNYTGSGTAAINTFAVGANTALASTGKFLVWQRNVTGGGPTADVATVTFVFSRPVSNLTLTLTDLDRDVATADFVDRVTFDAFASSGSTTPIDLLSSAFSGAGLNIKNKFVGTGSGAPATSTAAAAPAFKKNAVTGIAENPGTTDGDVTVSFPSPVQRVTFTYENIADFTTNTSDRTHTIGFENITFCAQSDVFAAFTNGPTAALAGTSASYTVQFGNNGPDNSATTPRTVTIPSGVTNLVLPAGATRTGNVIDFGTVPTTSGSSASFTYSYTLPTTPGIYYATNTANVGTSASQATGTTANDSNTRTTVVTPITDVATTISGPASSTQGNLMTLDVTTSNLGTSPTAGVTQTVQLLNGLTNVFVSNNGLYDSGTGVVTFPALATLAAGQTVANTISFSTPATQFNPVARVSLAAGPAGDSNNANNTAYYNGAAASTNFPINTAPSSAGVVNLYTTITSSAQTVSAGTNVTLTVTAANAGPATATNAIETVQLLPGSTAATLQVGGQTGSLSGNTLSFANGASYNTSTGLLTFPAIGTLASAASQTYSIVFTAPANVDGAVLATASLNATSSNAAQITTDPVVADNVASTKINIVPSTDLTASLTGPSTVSAGQSVTYTAIYLNNGPSGATGLLPTVQLPQGLSGVTLSEGSYNSVSGVVTFPGLATSLPGTAQIYTISYTPAIPGSYPATAYIRSSSPEANTANNSSGIVTSVTTSADLTVKLSGPTTAPAVNGAVTYVAESTNNGPSTSGTLMTTIQLPANLAAAPTLSANGTYAPATGLVTFNNAALANGATVTNYATYRNAVVAPSQPIVAGTTVSGAATVTGATVTDPVPTNNTSSTAGSNVVAATAAGTDYASTVTAGLVTGGNVTLTVVYDNTLSAAAVSGIAEILYLPPGTVVPASASYSYDMPTGVLTFAGTALAKSGTNVKDTYTVTIPVPTAGSLTAVSVISGPYTEAATATANNVSAVVVNAVATVPPTAYDETTVISGPDMALPGSPLTFTVQTTNNGPANTPSAVQTVTLPAGVTATNISNGGMQSANIITYPTITNQAPGTGGIVTNMFTIPMAAQGTGALTVQANVTAPGESSTANNSASATTQPVNQAPVAYAVVNAKQTPEGNTAGPLLISPLVGTDADNGLSGFLVTSVPDAATQGTLFYDNAGTLAAITAADLSTLLLSPAQAATLRFDPVSSFVGNAFFTYVAVDNSFAQSFPVLYTIEVGQDNASLYGVTPTKGGTLANGNTKYANGDVLAYVVDVNGAQFNSAGLMYNPTTGVLNAGAANGLPTSGTNVTSTTTPAQFAALGFALNPATGIISVADRTLLVAGSYPFTLTTTDLLGGVTTQVVTLVIGAKPLPVELKDFTAAAVKNLDAALTWTTASEANNDHFDVERSFNGSDFVAIAQVKGKGTSTAPTDYALTDAGVGRKASGPVYYRLKQVDITGALAYSPMRTVAFTAEVLTVPAIGLAPNPATTTVQLDLTTLPAGTYQVSVVDVMGRTVLSASHDTRVAHALELNTIASGTYQVLVRGQNGGQVVNLSKRLIKE